MLDRAERLNVDVLDVLAAQSAGDPEAPYRNLAHCLGVAYCQDATPFIGALDADADNGTLGDLRSIRGTRGAMLFVAPRLDQIASLLARFRPDPELREKICIVSPISLQAALAASNSEALLDNAVQRLARAFPFGSAHPDLPLLLRGGLVVAVIGLIIASMADLSGGRL